MKKFSLNVLLLAVLGISGVNTASAATITNGGVTIGFSKLKIVQTDGINIHLLGTISGKIAYYATSSGSSFTQIGNAGDSVELQINSVPAGPRSDCVVVATGTKMRDDLALALKPTYLGNGMQISAPMNGGGYTGTLVSNGTNSWLITLSAPATLVSGNALNCASIN